MLVKLAIQNVQRIKAVDITPKGRRVVLSGKNAQGKTSVLDSIEMGIAGARRICQRPIHEGADSGTIFMHWKDEFNDIEITRKFTDGRSELIVKDKGRRITGGQSLLDELTGKGIATDPTEFARQDAKRQLETLKSMVDCDTSELDTARADLYEQRTLAGRDVTSRKAQVESMPEYPDATAKEISVADLSKKLNAAHAHNARVEQLRQAAKDAANTMENNAILIESAKAAEAKTIARINAANEAKAAIDPDKLNSEKLRVAAEIQGITNEIEKLQAALEAAESHFNQLVRQSDDLEHIEESLSQLQAQLAEETAAVATWRTDEESARAEFETANAAAIAAKTVDTSAISKAIAEADATNKKVRANDAKKAMRKQFQELHAQYEDLTGQIDAIDRQKAKMISDAKFPIPGLGFGLHGVLYNGIPFKQASSAEQLRVSTAIALALCPDRPDAMKILLVRDASLLDDDSLKLISDHAEANGADLWLEMVNRDADADVIIEDGMVKGAAE